MGDFENVAFAVGIVGEKAAGKGLLSRLLQERAGFFGVRLSDPIRVADIIERAGKTPDADTLARQTSEMLSGHTEGGDFFGEAFYASVNMKPPTTFALQDLANGLRATHGGGFFMETALRAAALLRKERVALDGIRNPGEIAPLERLVPGRWVLAGVVADANVRKNRFLEKRRRVGDPATEEDFLRLDRRDKGDGEPPNGQQVAACLSLVKPENMLVNNGTVREFSESVEWWIERYRSCLADHHSI